MLAVLAVVGLAGCEDREIKKYTAPREKVAPDVTRLADYRVPEGWTRSTKPAEFALASFQAAGDDKQVAVTVSRLPGQAGGLMANVERWRKKVGLPTDDQEQLAKDLLWLKIDGEKTPYVDLSNPAKSDAERILGVVAYKGPVTWIFYMHGPPDQVNREKAAFLGFVESVKFGDNGANDG